MQRLNQLIGKDEVFLGLLSSYNFFHFHVLAYFFLFIQFFLPDFSVWLISLASSSSNFFLLLHFLYAFTVWLISSCSYFLADFSIGLVSLASSSYNFFHFNRFAYFFLIIFSSWFLCLAYFSGFFLNHEKHHYNFFPKHCRELPSKSLQKISF